MKITSDNININYNTSQRDEIACETKEDSEKDFNTTFEELMRHDSDEENDLKLQHLTKDKKKDDDFTDSNICSTSFIQPQQKICRDDKDAKINHKLNADDNSIKNLVNQVLLNKCESSSVDQTNKILETSNEKLNVSKDSLTLADISTKSLHKHLSAANQDISSINSKFDPVNFGLQTSGNEVKVGDHIALKHSHTPNSSPIIDAVILVNKQHDNLQMLKIRLHPAELGTVDAKIRIKDNSLYIDLQAKDNQAAYLLAKDTKILHKVLSNTGLEDYKNIYISVTSRDGQQVQNLDQNFAMYKDNNPFKNSDGQSSFDRNSSKNNQNNQESFDVEKIILQDDNSHGSSVEQSNTSLKGNYVI